MALDPLPVERSSPNNPSDHLQPTDLYVPAAHGVGSVIAGRYKLIEVIGEGGMGEVWAAEQIEPVRRRVAVKVIRSGLDSHQSLARFEAERQALALMDHPNIAKVLDAGATATGRPYFVMELVRGVPINTYCDRHRLSPRQRLELFIPVCRAIQHAHQKGIIHRDIKPSNILVESHEGRASPKVIDFGVSKAMAQPLTHLTLNTGFGTVVGTLAYMAPEQAATDASDVDTRADVYALGVVLYELLAGSTPFDPDRLKKAALHEVVRVIREEDPPRPSTKLSTADALPNLAANRATEPNRLVRLLRGDVEWVVMKCLEKDRDRRYETANALALDLERYLSDEPVLAGPPTVAYRVRKFVRRNQGGVLASALVLLALVGGIVGTTWGLFEARRQRDAAEQARQDEAVQRGLAEKNASDANLQKIEAQRQRTEAQKQAAIAYAVNDFLQTDLLGQASARKQASPTTKPDLNLTVKTAVDRAAQKIAGRFDKQPLVEAAIRRTIGWAYRDLGDLPAAQIQFDHALELVRKAKGEEDPETIDITSDVAMMHRLQGRYEESESLCREVVDQARRTLGENHPVTLRAIGALANVLVARGKQPEAETLLLRVLDYEKNTFGEENAQTLVSMNTLGNIYKDEAKYPEAVELYRKVHEVRLRQLGEEHPDTVSVENNLAIVYKLQGDYDQARQLYEHVLDVRRRVLGEDHPNTLISINNIALLLLDEARYAEAEKMLAAAQELCQRKLGEDHPMNLSMLDNLAELHDWQGRHDQAESLFGKVLALRRGKLGEDHPDTLTTMHGMAIAQAHQGKMDEAEMLLNQVIEVRRRVQGNEHPDLASALDELGQNRLKQKRYAEAEPPLREALAILQKSTPGLVVRFIPQSALGGSLLGQQKYAEAEPVLLECHKGLKQLKTQSLERGKYLAKTAERLVELYTAWEKPEEAARWQKELEDVSKKSPLP